MPGCVGCSRADWDTSCVHCVKVGIPTSKHRTQLVSQTSIPVTSSWFFRILEDKQFTVCITSYIVIYWTFWVCNEEWVLISDQWGRRGWECAGGFDMHVYCVHYTICSDWLIYLVNDLPICLGTSLLTYLFTYLLTYLLTYSMQHSPSWEANRFSASQQIPRIKCNP